MYSRHRTNNIQLWCKYADLLAACTPGVPRPGDAADDDHLLDLHRLAEFQGHRRVLGADGKAIGVQFEAFDADVSADIDEGVDMAGPYVGLSTIDQHQVAVVEQRDHAVARHADNAALVSLQSLVVDPSGSEGDRRERHGVVTRGARSGRQFHVKSLDHDKLARARDLLMGGEAGPAWADVELQIQDLADGLKLLK